MFVYVPYPLAAPCLSHHWQLRRWTLVLPIHYRPPLPSLISQTNRHLSSILWKKYLQGDINYRKSRSFFVLFMSNMIWTNENRARGNYILSLGPSFQLKAADAEHRLPKRARTTPWCAKHPPGSARKNDCGKSVKRRTSDGFDTFFYDDVSLYDYEMAMLLAR